MSTVESIIGGVLVEWDEKKAAINKQKHGVSFEDAALVFTDINRIERRDKTHSQDEDRWQAIGMVEDILFVVYTERVETLRIIMARKLMLTKGENIMERRIIYRGQKPTPEQVERLRALKAENRPIVYDDEFPELTDEELKEFRRVNPRRKDKAVG